MNDYIVSFEEQGYLKRNYQNTKSVAYQITKKGIERKKLLNIWYIRSSYLLYSSAKDNIIAFLKQIIDKGFKKILLYGAGEVAEIILQTLKEESISLKVIALIDDDKTKEGSKILNTSIIGPHQIGQYEHDGILVSSYTHQQAIYTKLVGMLYDKSRIIQFFDH